MPDMTSTAVGCDQQLPQVSYGHMRRWQQTWWRGFRLVQSPYLICTRSLTGLVFALNWWDVMDDHIVLGGALMLDDIERLRQQGVRAVINLCVERPDDQQRLAAVRMDYLWLPVRDAYPPTMAQIFTGITWIEQHVQQGAIVYIHCATGIGRSVTLFACWSMYAQAMNLPYVWQCIKKRRPQATLTRRQVRRLEEFAALQQQKTPALGV